MSFDPNRVDQIVETLAAMLQRRSIARELETLKRFVVQPEQIDELLVAAINTSFNLEDERLAAEIPPLSIATAVSKTRQGRVSRERLNRGKSMQPQNTDRMIKALENLMSSGSSVSRSLQTIKRYSLAAERIDDAILAAINASLCLSSDGDDHVAEGFNDDIARNGRNFGRRDPPGARLWLACENPVCCRGQHHRLDIVEIEPPQIGRHLLLIPGMPPLRTVRSLLAKRPKGPGGGA